MKLPRQSGEQTKRARRLRADMSESQKKLWQELRRHKTGFHFKREVPFKQYTLDFYCHEAKLCVEVDGFFHDQAHDAKRDAFLKLHGIETLRLSSHDCIQDSEAMAATVRIFCIKLSGRDPDAPPP